MYRKLRLLSFFISPILFTGIISAHAQTTGFTYKAGLNAGNPITKRAPISEIIDFKGYDETLASSDNGQTFEITLLSQHILKFNLKKSGSPLSAVSFQTNTKASMGRIAYDPLIPFALPALYSATKPCDVNLTLSEIGVFEKDGISQLPNWTLIIGDAEVTNILESTSTTTNGQHWVQWDLITNSFNNPSESGIGTSTVNWSGSVNTATGAYLASSIKPSKITSVLKGVRQGIVFAIQSYVGDRFVEACSGSTFDATPGLVTASDFTYTWSAPVISGDLGQASLTGGSAQSTALSTISQTLINNTGNTAWATYTITPHHQTDDLEPFTVTVAVSSIAVTASATSTTVCAGTAVILSGGGAASYTWDKGVTNNLSFIPVRTETYTVTGITLGGCVDTDTVTITVIPCPPVPLPDKFIELEGQPLFGSVADNDTDPTKEGLKFSVITPPSSGSLTFKPDGTFTFVPLPDWYGTTSFEYQACNRQNVCVPSSVTIIVTAVNDAPVAVDDAYTTSEEIPLTLPAPGIIANDKDVDGGILNAVKVTDPANGIISMDADGSLTYTPNKDFAGADSFTYYVMDDSLRSNIAIVIINVIPVNDLPFAINDSYTNEEDKTITGSVAANDHDAENDPLRFNLISQPADGEIVFNNDGSFNFTPGPDWSGSTKFDYEVCDDQYQCSRATATLTTTPANDPPVAADDAYTTSEDTPITITAPGIMVNDNDIDGDLIFPIKTFDTANGTITLNANGSFTYIPAPNFSGIDFFRYKVSDSLLESNLATVTITVVGVNDPPTGENDQFNVSGGKEFAGKLIISDPDGDPVVLVEVAAPENGEVVINPDGTFIYIPNDGYFGPDEFYYKVCDGTGSCKEAKITLTIIPQAIVNLTPAFTIIPEGSQLRITAVLTAPLNEDVEITLAYSGDAQKGKDFKLFENFVTLLIPAGNTVTEESVLISTLVDYLNEKDEHILVSISKVSTKTIKIGTPADVMILDVYPMDKEVDEMNQNVDIKPSPLMSPNSDDRGNENFNITNIGAFPDNEVIIFNRWGNEVYRITGYDNYDRSFRGTANKGILTNVNTTLPEGVYYYIIYTSTLNGNIKKMNKGYFILKR